MITSFTVVSHLTFSPRKERTQLTHQFQRRREPMRMAPREMLPLLVHPLCQPFLSVQLLVWSTAGSPGPTRVDRQHPDSEKSMLLSDPQLRRPRASAYEQVDLPGGTDLADKCGCPSETFEGAEIN
jgi:hypothetical protein